MERYFPNCPICKSTDGYIAEGTFIKTVTCKNCGAKFQSQEFKNLKPMTEMQLWDTPRDGRFSDLRLKMKPIEFWTQFNSQELSRYSEQYEEALIKGQILVSSDMSDQELWIGIANAQTEFAFYFNRMTGGKGWDILHTLFSSGSDLERRQMWMTLALINQNSVIVRQNEMIRRLLEKIANSQNHNLDS